MRSIPCRPCGCSAGTCPRGLSWQSSGPWRKSRPSGSRRRPSSPRAIAHQSLGAAYLYNGMHREPWPSRSRTAAQSTGSRSLALIGHTLAPTGRRAEALEILRQVESRSGEAGKWESRAIRHIALGDRGPRAGRRASRFSRPGPHPGRSAVGPRALGPAVCSDLGESWAWALNAARFRFDTFLRSPQLMSLGGGTWPHRLGAAASRSSSRLSQFWPAGSLRGATPRAAEP